MSGFPRVRPLLGRLTTLRAKENGWALLAQGGVLVSGLANLLLLARLVGPADYGVVAGVLAVVYTVGPLAALGADKLVVRDISSQDVAARTALTTALVTGLLGALAATAAVLVVLPVLLPAAPLTLVVALCVAELVAGIVITCSSGARWASGDARGGSLTTSATSVAKLLAVVVFAVTGEPETVRWAVLYAGASSIAAVLAVAWAFARFGRPALDGYRFRSRAREGLPYSLNVSATIAQNDADKALLVRYGYAVEAGLYSVAYRLATIAWLPVLAVLQANFPRFFAVGSQDGLEGTAAMARRLRRPLLVYGVVAALGLLVVAPLVPLLVGAEYQGSVVLVVLLAPLALVKVVQYVSSDALTGGGHQGTRTRCILASLVLNVTLNLLLIPSHGLVGALVATAASETLYAVLANVALRRGVARERAAAAPR